MQVNFMSRSCRLRRELGVVDTGSLLLAGGMHRPRSAGPTASRTMQGGPRPHAAFCNGSPA